MPSANTPVLNTFVLRLWLEGGRQWRGQITHLPSNERRYLASFEQLISFIGEHAPGFPAGPSEGSEQLAVGS